MWLSYFQGVLIVGLYLFIRAGVYGRPTHVIFIWTFSSASDKHFLCMPCMEYEAITFYLAFYKIKKNKHILGNKTVRVGRVIENKDFCILGLRDHQTSGSEMAIAPPNIS